MVFSEVHYHNRSFVHWPSCIAADLVASGNITRIEDRTHPSDSRAELAALSINPAIHSDDQGILQNAEFHVAKGFKRTAGTSFHWEKGENHG